MQLGVTVRNMGVQATADLIIACAQSAQRLGMESVWVVDHIAIPPDDAQGSGGRYLDVLTTLAWLAGQTTRIKVGSGVLILPYRPLLPSAKQIATIQELSANRLILGVGIGWMDAEFRALGVDRHARGKISDNTLGFFRECFARDEVTLNGQDFLFRPRPLPPPILVGGAAPHALKRAVALGDGWLPMAKSPQHIAQDVQNYFDLCAQAGKQGSVTVMTGLPLDEEECQRHIDAYAEMGVQRVVCSIQYDDLDSYEQRLQQLRQLNLQWQD